MGFQVTPEFITDTKSLLRKSFKDHQGSYLDLLARAIVDHTISKLSPNDAPGLPISFRGETSESDRPGRIGIVGAGATGLYAALILQDLGIEYEILEATDRVGGRITMTSISSSLLS